MPSRCGSSLRISSVFKSINYGLISFFNFYRYFSKSRDTMFVVDNKEDIIILSSSVFVGCSFALSRAIIDQYLYLYHKNRMNCNSVNDSFCSIKKCCSSVGFLHFSLVLNALIQHGLVTLSFDVFFSDRGKLIYGVYNSVMFFFLVPIVYGKYSLVYVFEPCGLSQKAYANYLRFICRALDGASSSAFLYGFIDYFLYDITFLDTSVSAELLLNYRHWLVAYVAANGLGSLFAGISDSTMIQYQKHIKETMTVATCFNRAEYGSKFFRSIVFALSLVSLAFRILNVNGSHYDLTNHVFMWVLGVSAFVFMLLFGFIDCITSSDNNINNLVGYESLPSKPTSFFYSPRSSRTLTNGMNKSKDHFSTNSSDTIGELTPSRGCCCL